MILGEFRARFTLELTLLGTRAAKHTSMRILASMSFNTKKIELQFDLKTKTKNVS
jgi:hypothetical protein